jgi:phosphoglucosamine mutase
MRKLFGTDGIRGVAGEYPLDAHTSYVIGRAVGHYLQRSHPAPRVVIGRDTRESSEAIGAAVGGGLRSHGVEVVSAGVLTTPGVAFVTRRHGFAAGVVISASHNPWRDNGIKIFGADGYKLADEVELEIERDIFAHLEEAGAADGRGAKLAPLPAQTALAGSYAEWLAASVGGGRLETLKAIVDCANGAAAPLAPEVFRRCGVEAKFLNAEPNGRNINDHCGALYPERVADAVRRANADSRKPKYAVGVSFDGDADRALFADAEGNIVNGDAVLLLAARMMKQRGALPHDLVVATTMSNMGLETALRDSGIKLLRAQVGDRYVLEEMRRTGATLGGEQSGHIIFRDGDATTGDGLLTALRVIAAMARSGQSLRDLTADMVVFPQIIKSVRVRERKPLDQVPEVVEAIRLAEQELDGDGRVVVRYSGTEALARVMVEAESEEKMRRIADEIASAIQRNLGV